MSERLLNIHDLIQTSNLFKIANKIDYLHDIQNKFFAIIDVDFQPFCRIANIKAHELVIATSNASVRMALIMQEEKILRCLSKDFADINTLKIIVTPDF